MRVDIDIHKRLKDIKGNDRTWEDFLVEAGLNYVKAKEGEAT